MSNNNSKSEEPTGKKITFNAVEEENRLTKLNKKHLREEKLKKLREIRNKQEKVVEGDIHVKLLNGNDINNSLKRDNQILNQKDKWLNRKRVRRE